MLKKNYHNAHTLTLSKVVHGGTALPTRHAPRHTTLIDLTYRTPLHGTTLRLLLSNLNLFLDVKCPH